ncbi:hypothetical protein DKM44_02385 [Deinococcus irradiatisoli]|uniref:Uncharacterized protein n=1 Tax=Deinococcus irradiatisoli TaxID=2202254 RepID=A0A2Z3JBA2_9DEIO|nr:hypothetical protein [Deinococcus irradiatisoli]AWN22225.1 hypothetical protein DKM44_02385 [Deinococcus irradiatisoli]
MNVGAGEIAGWLTAGVTLLISALTLISKNKGDSFTRTEAERARLDSENKSLKAQIDALKEKLNACEDMKHRYTVLIEFLGDILSNAYTLDWIKIRAQSLKDREKP